MDEPLKNAVVEEEPEDLKAIKSAFVQMCNRYALLGQDLKELAIRLSFALGGDGPAEG